MIDTNVHKSASVMESFSAAAAAEPYESVRSAFVSYGSCSLDLAKGWKYRSRMWYKADLILKSSLFGGGGSGWESWKLAFEKDSNGDWIELPLVKKSISMLQALLLDEFGVGDGLGIGGGSFAKKGAVTTLYQLLDSDQPFLCMLRMILASMREDDCGVDDIVLRDISVKDDISEGLHYQASNKLPLDNSSQFSTRNSCPELLWRQAYLKHNLEFVFLSADISTTICLHFKFTLDCLAPTRLLHFKNKDSKEPDPCF